MLQGTPTDTNVITKLTNTIHNDIDFGNTPDYINVEKEDIIQAIDKLNSNQGDGGERVSLKPPYIWQEYSPYIFSKPYSMYCTPWLHTIVPFQM